MKFDPYHIKKIFQFENDYFRVLGNPFRYFINQGPIIKHLLDRIRFRIFPKLGIVSEYPTHIDIEAVSQCQLRCPMCWTTYLPDNIKGKMKYEVFKKIIDEVAGKGVYSVRLSWRGESLIHPDIIKMIQYAKEKGIPEVAFLSNAGRLDKKMAEAIVDSGLDWISFSADGVDEVYNEIRKPLKFNDTIEKIQYLKNYRDNQGLNKPLIRVQSIISAMISNSEKFENVWKGVCDRVNVISDENRLFEEEQQHDKYYMCPTPWQRLTIAHDGRVHQCKADYTAAQILGDINVSSVYEIWHGSPIKELRNRFRKNEAVDHYKACSFCSDNVIQENRVEYFAKTKKTLAKFKGINDVVREDGEVRIKYDKKNKMPIVIDK